MDVIIPVRNNPDNFTLRYAIRSICLYEQVDNVIIVGGKPAWFSGTHIPHEDYTLDRKEDNIRDKTFAGSKHTTGPFIFANDDHYLLAPLPPVTHNKGKLAECIKVRMPNGSYTRLLKNTFDIYGDVDNVDTHCPMVMTPEGVERCMFDWPQWGIGFKTTYAQENGVESVYHPDAKINDVLRANLISSPYFSTAAGCRNLQHLKNIFPDPCRFEK